MKALMINSVCGIRSTGRICTDIAKELEEQGYEVKIAYGREEVPEEYSDYAVRVGNDFDTKLHGIRTRLFDDHGFGSKHVTRTFLNWAERYNPDLLWLHNIHGYYINIELLFDWIKSRPDMEVRWTLHDCWSFTGHCSHFSYVGCEKWKIQCKDCPQKRQYPASYIYDNSRENYLQKKKLFTGVQRMTLITPSEWLADLVKQSFLGEYPVVVRHNTIDVSVFKPTPGNFRDDYGCCDKKILLGVASAWNERKGLQDFIKLSSMLNDEYQLILVGIDSKQAKRVPPNILCIERTNSVRELAEIYTAADVFLNLTYEDTYPTVNLEAAACGTPVITYETGGSVESVPPENVVPQGDLNALIKCIERILEEETGK